MSTIITTQDEILALIDALIAATTIPATFTTQDEDISKGSLPLVVVDIKTSDPENLSSGETALVDHHLELIVVVPISDHSDVLRTARNFAIDNFMIILNSLSIDCGVVYYESGIYDEHRCARVRTRILAFDNG